MRYLFTAVAVIGIQLCYANGGQYAVSAIPPSLLKGADVVKRMEDIRFQIINTGETIYDAKYALTILNENGDKRAEFSEWYDKLREIKSIDGTLYDANGNVVKHLKGKDIKDLSIVGDNNLMDDNRIKTHNFYCKVYPYTVEYEVEIKYNNSLFFPYWMPQEDENFSVQKSRFTIVAPADYNVRYKSYNYKTEPAIATEKNKKIMVWEINDLPATKNEYAAPGWWEITPTVYFAPTDFEIEGYKGNMNNWKEFGKFQYSLKKDRDKLPDNIKQKVHEVIAGLSTDKEKSAALYQFMQQHTRYVSVQLGIGGWQPFDATYVGQKGYGDCKALTNYMFSLLKEAGINSYYALVLSGAERSITEDFPSQQFDHVILCVPLQRDTMWLECTSQIETAGYMGSFTGNRKALLITENGGVLVSTPKYGRKENRQVRSIKGAIDEQGNLTTQVETLYSGIQQDHLHDMLSYLSKEKVKEHLNKQFELATYDIKDFKYDEKKQQLPEIDEDLNIEVSNFAALSGKRLFITPNLLNRSTRKLNMEEERKYDIQFNTEFTDVDSIEVTLPSGYEAEALPKNVILQTEFGSYTSSLKYTNNKLYYYRKREQYAGRFPAKDYDMLVNFYSEIYKADRSKVVLVKKG